MRKDVIMRAMPVLGYKIVSYQNEVEKNLLAYQLYGDKYYAECAALYQHEANALADLANDLAAELDRQRQQ